MRVEDDRVQFVRIEDRARRDHYLAIAVCFSRRDDHTDLALRRIDLFDLDVHHLPHRQDQPRPHDHLTIDHKPFRNEGKLYTIHRTSFTLHWRVRLSLECRESPDQNEAAPCRITESEPSLLTFGAVALISPVGNTPGLNLTITARLLHDIESFVGRGDKPLILLSLQFIPNDRQRRFGLATQHCLRPLMEREP